MGVNKQLMTDVSGLRLGPPRLPVTPCPPSVAKSVLQKYQSVFLECWLLLNVKIITGNQDWSAMCFKQKYWNTFSLRRNNNNTAANHTQFSGLPLKDEAVLFTSYDLISVIKKYLTLNGHYKIKLNSINYDKRMACMKVKHFFYIGHILSGGSVGSTCAASRDQIRIFSLLWVKVTIWILNSGLFFYHRGINSVFI